MPRMDTADQSDRLAFYESGRFPKLRGIANTVPWLWPLAGLAAIALFVLAYLKAAAQKSAMSTIGIGVLVTGVVSLLLVPAVRAPAQNAVTNPAMQTVVAEVLRAVTRGLAIQSLLLGFIGIVLIVASHSVHKEDAQAAASPAAPAQPPAHQPAASGARPAASDTRPAASGTGPAASVNITRVWRGRPWPVRNPFQSAGAGARNRRPQEGGGEPLKRSRPVRTGFKSLAGSARPIGSLAD